MAVPVTGLEGICLCRGGKTFPEDGDIAAGEWEERQEGGTLKTKEEEWPVASHATERASDTRANVTRGPS